MNAATAITVTPDGEPVPDPSNASSSIIRSVGRVLLGLAVAGLCLSYSIGGLEIHHNEFSLISSSLMSSHGNHSSVQFIRSGTSAMNQSTSSSSSSSSAQVKKSSNLKPTPKVSAERMYRASERCLYVQ